MARNTRTPRSAVRDQAMLIIGKAERSRSVDRPLIEARRIAEEHPDSDMTVDEIREEIFRLAVERRLVAYAPRDQRPARRSR